MSDRKDDIFDSLLSRHLSDKLDRHVGRAPAAFERALAENARPVTSRPSFWRIVVSAGAMAAVVALAITLIPKLARNGTSPLTNAVIPTGQSTDDPSIDESIPVER